MAAKRNTGWVKPIHRQARRIGGDALGFLALDTGKAAAADEAAPTRFVWFEAYAEILGQVPEDERRAKLALTMCEYRALEREPDFGEGWALAAIFEAARIVSDNGIRAYINSGKGR